eukprot:jgi/Ulvmu1/8518/UM044_0052.1
MPRSDSSSSSSSDDDQLTAGQATRDAPLEVLYEGTEYYKELGKESDLREPYRVPYEVVEGLFEMVAPERAPTPLLVFINSRSGGRAGPELTRAFQRSVGYTQVFDLGTHKPDGVLRQVYANLDKIAAARPQDALHMRQQLRIVACGGDGTVAWVLQTIGRLGLQPEPPVAVVPLGTGNDLARSFGWGGMFEKSWIKDHAALHKTLGWFGQAAAAPLDRWRLSLTAPGKGFFNRKKPYGFVPDGPVEVCAPHLPPQTAPAGLRASNSKHAQHTQHVQFRQQEQHANHAQHVIQAQHAQRAAAVQEAKKFTAESWNYVSIGMDAKSAFGFHHLRETKPALAFSRVANQAWYGYFSCASGWFCGAEPISRRMRLEVLAAGGKEWREIEVGASIQAIVLLNLQSYGGGRNIWGDHDTDAQERGFIKPANNDGLIEVVGFKSGFHAGAVMSGTAHGVRLAQAHGVRVHVRGSDEQRKTKKNGMGKMYLQLDGEPWKQDVPDYNTGEEMLVELEYAGQSQLLVRPGTGGQRTATTAAAAAAEAQHLDKLAAIKATHHPAQPKGAAVAPVEVAPKAVEAVPPPPPPNGVQLAVGGVVGGAARAGEGAAHLPPGEAVATRHGVSPSHGSELPTPVPQQPTSEDGASPEDASGASPPAEPVASGDDAAGHAGEYAMENGEGNGAEGALVDVGGADGTAAYAGDGPASGFEDVREGTMRATDPENGAKQPGPQAVLQSVDYEWGTKLV